MEAVKTKNNIHDFRSELNQISWISSCGAREINIRVKLERDYISQHREIDPYFWCETSEDSWILDDKYKDSRTKVIGKAIDIITFERTNPETYGPENWNAVILYNYVHEAINGVSSWEDFRNVQRTLQYKLKTIEGFYKKKYGLSNIDLTKAVQDIQKYVKTLRLSSSLLIHRNRKLEYKQNLSPSSLSPIAIEGDANYSIFDKSFYKVADSIVQYKVNFGYFEGNLYIVDLDILNAYRLDKTGVFYWRRANDFTVNSIDELENKSKWLRELLGEIVKLPAKDLWKKLRQQKEDLLKKQEKAHGTKDEDQI